MVTVGNGEQATGAANRVLELQSRAATEVKSPDSNPSVQSSSHPTSFFLFFFSLSGLVFFYLEIIIDSEEVAKIVQRCTKLHFVNLHLKRQYRVLPSLPQWLWDYSSTSKPGN